MNFTCARCRRDHPALPPEEPPEDAAKIAVLRAAYHEAYARWSVRWRPLPTVAFIDSKFLQGQAAVRWTRFALDHLAAGRIEAAWGCLEAAAKRWERRKQLLRPSEWERREVAVEKAGMAHGVASRRTGAWRVPPTLMSIQEESITGRKEEREWALVCTESCTPRPRGDGLKVARPFFVIHAFDNEGFHSALVARTPEKVKELAAKRSANKSSGIVACSLPFPGKWTPSSLGGGGYIVDVGMPSDFILALVAVDKPKRDEE
jgi:hypothetical protein